MLGLLQKHYQLCSLNLLSFISAFVSPDCKWNANPMAETYYTPCNQNLNGKSVITEHPSPSTSIVFVQASERYTLSDCMSRGDAKDLHCGAGLGDWLHCRQTHVPENEISVPKDGRNTAHSCPPMQKLTKM